MSMLDWLKHDRDIKIHEKPDKRMKSFKDGFDEINIETVEQTVN